MRMRREKRTTRHEGTKLVVVCGSFLAFAALAAFISSREPPAEPSATQPVVAEQTAEGDGSGTVVERPTPVTRTRGT